MYKVKSAIQAIDPITGIWTKAKVIQVTGDGNLKVTWPGFSSRYDCIIKKKEARIPTQERQIQDRNTRKKFSEMCKGEAVLDQTKKRFVVQVNDPFNGEVGILFDSKH